MSETQFDVIVVGAGPGGYVAAIRSAQLGLKTALVESNQVGGICLNWGCIPTKALLKGAEYAQYLKKAPQFGFTISSVEFDLQRLVQHSRQVSEQLVNGIHYLLKKNNVSLIQAFAQFKEKGKLNLTDAQGQVRTISGTHIIIATGARARVMPQLPIDGEYVWSYKEALQPKSLPKTLLVVGSGAIGSEFASLYQQLGSYVTLIDLAPQILPNEDTEVSALVKKQFEQSGMRVLTGATLQHIEVINGQVQCQIKTAQGVETQYFDKVLSALGVVPNVEKLGVESLGMVLDNGFIQTDEWGRTNVAGIYAIGDVAGTPCLAHKASHQAISCVEKIAGVPSAHPLNKQMIPSCTFTFPQVASIGLTEQQAKAQQLPIRVGKFPLQANGKALAQGASEGFVKTIVHAQTGEILGVHMVGHDVTELIHGVSIAKSLEATDESLAGVIFPHPSLSESIHESILATMQRAIHF